MKDANGNEIPGAGVLKDGYGHPVQAVALSPQEPGTVEALRDTKGALQQVAAQLAQAAAAHEKLQGDYSEALVNIEALATRNAALETELEESAARYQAAYDRLAADLAAAHEAKVDPPADGGA